MPKPTKRVLVTGATGFIGANLARRLLSDGHEVHLLVRPAETRWRIAAIADRVHLHEVTLEQRALVDRVVRDVDPHWVFHLAAYGAYSSQRDVQTIVTTNFNGTVNLLEACLATDFEAFVNAGSSSEYGFKDHAPLESELTDPNSHYAVSKAAATLYCRFTALQAERHVSTLRLYSVFGPWEDPTRLLPTLVVYGLRGELPPLVSPGIARDYVYVDDAIEAFLLTAAASEVARGSIFNVGTGIQTTLAQLVEMVREAFGITVEPQWGSMPDRAWDTDIWVCDPTLISASIGWKPARSLSEDLRAFARWLSSDDVLRRHYETSRDLPR
ncbi:MAG TPA: SDR family NAD(P)-dependent oxidoreductase [Acidimicrobiales bacterium]|nr:SDR family NAD(P)-dependent oxidoreductase [Acidimicrobiales bacterium]